jgi:uncharacterized protein YjbI with pentapeptide repeats
LLLAMVSMLVYLGWRSYRQARFESILTSVYSPAVPPALRIDYIDKLLYQYHQRTFDFLDLRGINLDNAILNGISFRSATLRNASLTNSSLHGANFSNAELSGAQFEHSDLMSADLTRAILTGADLAGANLVDANLQDADLRAANLTGANVSPDQLAKAVTDDKTILPNGKPGPVLNGKKTPSPELPDKPQGVYKK